LSEGSAVASMLSWGVLYECPMSSDELSRGNIDRGKSAVATGNGWEPRYYVKSCTPSTTKGCNVNLGDRWAVATTDERTVTRGF
jgi:hypothetical protein